MKIHRSMQRTSKHRSGVVLIVVLACLAIISTLLMLVCRNALSLRRETRIRSQLQQTELLLDAGILRASQHLQRSPDYKGETWRPAAALPRFENATVIITVEPVGDENQVTVVASLGGDYSNAHATMARRTQRRHTFRN